MATKGAKELNPEVDFTIVLTGPSGSGKSATGNFFLQEVVFESGYGTDPITLERAAGKATIEGKRIKVIDTPGFLGPPTLSAVKEPKELARAILELRNGISALGIVINITERFHNSKEVVSALLRMKDLVPYTFFIFTHTFKYGRTDMEHKAKFEEIRKSKLPQVLETALCDTNNRFILLESSVKMEEGYSSVKSQELINILQEIMAKNKKEYVGSLSLIAQLFEKFSNAEKREIEDELAKEIEELAKDKAVSYDKLLNIIYDAACSVVNGVFSTIKSGVSKLFDIFARRLDLAKKTVKIIGDYLANQKKQKAIA